MLRHYQPVPAERGKCLDPDKGTFIENQKVAFNIKVTRSARWLSCFFFVLFSFSVITPPQAVVSTETPQAGPGQRTISVQIFSSIYQGLTSKLHIYPRARERFSSWRDKGATTRKLPTPKFKFLLGVRPLYFENTYAKQKKNLEVHFCVKVGGASPLRSQSWRDDCPLCPPFSRAHVFVSIILPNDDGIISNAVFGNSKRCTDKNEATT